MLVIKVYLVDWIVDVDWSDILVTKTIHIVFSKTK